MPGIIQKNRIRVIVLSGGPSAEHDISRFSGRMVAGNVDKNNYRTTIAVIGRDGLWKFSDRKGRVDTARSLQWMQGRYDVAFLALHGAFGEDGTIQSLLQSIGMPYTGSGVSGSVMAWNKVAAQRCIEGLHFPVPTWMTVSKASEAKAWKKFPCFVKPVEGGSSLGVSLVKKKVQLKNVVRKTLHDFGPIIIQAYIKGRELTCGVIEKNGIPQALPPTEIFPLTNTWFDYQSKYSDDGHRLETPPRIPVQLRKHVQHLATQAHATFGCRGLSRSDFILSGKKIWYLETNTIPGLTKISLLPHEAQAAGMTFPQLLDLIITAAIRRR